MGKKILLYKLASELVQQLEEEEEDYEQEYNDNYDFVRLDNDDEDDGSALLAEYTAKLEQFTINQNIERQKLVESQTNCVLSNLQKRKFGDTAGLSRLMNMSLDQKNQQNITKAQEQLNMMEKQLKDIHDGPLATFFHVREYLAERLDVLHDNIAEVETYCLNHQQLLAIADKFGCVLTFDWRKNE